MSPIMSLDELNSKSISFLEIEDKRYIAQSETQYDRLTSLSREISWCRISNNCSVRVCSDEDGRFAELVGIYRYLLTFAKVWKFFNDSELKALFHACKGLMR